MPSLRQSGELALVCARTGCGRSFAKRQHLERHERSHAKDTRHACPVCGKQFVRRDVMTRHASIHGNPSAKVRKIACISCVKLKVKCNGAPGSTCSRCVSAKRECIYRSYGDSTGTTRQALSSHNEYESLDDVNASVQDNHPPAPSFASTGPSGSGISVEPQQVPSQDCGRVTPDTQDNYAFTADSFDVFAADLSQSFFGWNLGDASSEDLDFLNVSSLGWFPNSGAGMGNITPQAQSGINDKTARPSSPLIRDAQPSGTPWPHVYRPSEEDNEVNLLPAAPRPRLILKQLDGDWVNESSRQAIISLVNKTHQSNWPAVDAQSFPSTTTLSICINLYFRHFHETLPILRRHGFRQSETSPILLLSMAAIGAMYSRDGPRNLAVALNELARRAISTLSETDRSATFHLAFVQASLLQSVLGLFCGSRMLYQHAEISRCSLVTAARRMHLLRPGLSFVAELQKQPGLSTSEDLEKAYANDEERRNLGWGIYLYDMQLSVLLNIPPLFSIAEINASLPADDDITSPRNCTDPLPNFRVVLQSLLSTGTLEQPLSSFGLSVIAHTLYRLCTDAAAAESIFTRSVAPCVAPYKLAFPTSFTHNPQELLDLLSESCQSLRTRPNALTIGILALSHLAHMQFTWGGFLNSVKVAAGKSGTEESKAEARTWIQAQIAEDPIGARFILAQAGLLGAILARHPFDAPAESVLTLDVALTFWAIVKFSTDLSSACGLQDASSVVWPNCDDMSDWVKAGGEAYFQGVGDVGSLTSAGVLPIFKQRMDMMSWGLAERFKHVLIHLEREEVAGAVS